MSKLDPNLLFRLEKVVELIPLPVVREFRRDLFEFIESRKI